MTKSPGPAQSVADGPSSSTDGCPITTVIFDVDDTLYDVSTGFTAHRNTDGATSFMIEKLGFPDVATAQSLRDEYFERYHSTAKALTVAEAEGRLPPPTADVAGEGAREGPRFDPNELSEWWASELDFSILGGPDPALVSAMRSLRSAGLRLVAFSNGPRKYVLRVLEEIGMDEFFPPEMVFSVNDVLPSCKPEPESFERVFKAVGVKRPEECVMVEDSMKNVRAAKALGMRTVLVAGEGRLRVRQSRTGDGMDVDSVAAAAAEATKPGDAPKADDPAVDVAVEICAQMITAVPGLTQRPAVFSVAR
uniref:Uncharacterized protein n=1 Tax=Trieres chinensis TaxID=1514140 RepID=A0A7S2EBJ4_TRICV|mmetsp:Transcript_16431/g.33662  ORF Transcript_16431/g.33662 Transcript_16431/m.33662 type:complete len:307 (+) Transcript_16431:64-984(+)